MIFVTVAIIAEVYSRYIPDFDTTYRPQVEKGQYVEIELGLWMDPDSPRAPVLMRNILRSVMGIISLEIFWVYFVEDTFLALNYVPVERTCG